MNKDILGIFLFGFIGLLSLYYVANLDAQQLKTAIMSAIALPSLLIAWVLALSELFK